MFVDRNLLISSQEIFVLPKFRTFKCTGQLKWNLDITTGQELAKFVLYTEVSLYRGYFPYNLLLVIVNTTAAPALYMVGQ